MAQQPSIEEVNAESSSPSTQGRSNDDNTWRQHLYKVVVKGDWNTTKSLISSHPEALSTGLLMGETILHIAVLHNHKQLVVELLSTMSIAETEITLPYRRNSTALHLAAACGIVGIAKDLVEKNSNLLCLRDDHDYLPVTQASFFGNKDMVRYLYRVTPKEEINSIQSCGGVNVLIYAIRAEYYDFALEIHQHHKELTFIENENGSTPLQVLARKPSAFPSGNRLKYWQRWIYNCINVEQSYDGNGKGSVQTKVAKWLKELSWEAAKIFGIEQIYNTKLKNKQALELLTRMSDQVSTLSEIEERKVLTALESASEFGTVEFVIKMVKSNPTLLWKSTTQSRSIFDVAVEYRQDRIWNLIYDPGVQGVKIATFVWNLHGDSLLHEASKLAPKNRLNSVCGPTIQMQWELQWFKEVKTIVSPSVKEHEIMERERVFTEQHKDLMKEAEQWMRQTASSCMVMTTLIATVMFAAAFTVPGGNDSQSGIPILLSQTSFMVFIVADALSLFSSITSILMFLSIITSRYIEEDFINSLPRRLTIGLATLVLSIATMMVAFIATLVIVVDDRYKWVLIPIFIFLASVPVTFFTSLHIPLFVDIFLSTYGPSIFQTQTESLFNYSVLAQSTYTHNLDP